MAARKTKKPPAKRRKVGRPRVEFKLDELEKLGELHCTDVEVAAFFGCSRDTVAVRKKDDPEFSYALEKGRANGKRSLRRLQWKAAQGGNVTMMIWLGKQLLDQRDYRDPPLAPQKPNEKHSATLTDDTIGEGGSDG